MAILDQEPRVKNEVVKERDIPRRERTEYIVPPKVLRESGKELCLFAFTSGCQHLINQIEFNAEGKSFLCRFTITEHNFPLLRCFRRGIYYAWNHPKYSLAIRLQRLFKRLCTALF